MKPEEILEALQGQQAHGHAATESTIRVDVGLLDQLMNLVGQLVLTRNQILQFTKTTEETNLVTAGQRLNLIASELQERVMKTRMQPISGIWNQVPRVVRDVALACGKQVRIQVEGEGIELDKTLIEAIKDPMTHMVRIAVDQGIEQPEVLAEYWGFSEELFEAVRYHHHTDLVPKASPIVFLVHLSDLLCRLRNLGYGYDEIMAVAFAEDMAWGHLLTVYPALADIDLVRFTLDVDGSMDQIVALVDSVFASAKGSGASMA